MKLKRILIFILIVIFLSLLSVYYPYLIGRLTGKAVDSKEEYKLEQVFVIRVVDGDTIETDIGKVRLLGVNTPEKNRPYHKKAVEFLKEIENKSIKVLRDFEDTDRYKRKLRYVFYNNRFLNVEILEKGLGTAFMVDDLKYESKLINAEKFAKENERGLWEKSKDSCSMCIKLVELNPDKEFFVLKNICSFDCNLINWSVKDDANHFFKLEDMHSKEEKRYDSIQRVWNDDKDRFFMKDGEGKLVVFYEYTFSVG